MMVLVQPSRCWQVVALRDMIRFMRLRGREAWFETRASAYTAVAGVWFKFQDSQVVQLCLLGDRMFGDDQRHVWFDLRDCYK